MILSLTVLCGKKDRPDNQFALEVRANHNRKETTTMTEESIPQSSQDINPKTGRPYKLSLKLREKGRAWVEKNKERSWEIKRAWKQRNREKYLAQQREYARGRTQEMGENRRKWRNENREKFREGQKTYRSEQRSKSLRFSEEEKWRKVFSSFLKRKSDKMMPNRKYKFGCSPSEFRAHLQSQFLEEMSWENHGSVWEVDHIKPVRSFDVSIYDEALICFHFSNTRPLWCDENRRQQHRRLP